MWLTETCWNSLRPAETHWDSLTLTETYWDSLRLTETYVLRPIKTHWNLLRLTEFIDNTINQLFVDILQVQRVMSSHNNNSFSSLPFTPSSTSSLSSSYNVHAQQSIPHHQLPGFSAKNKMAAGSVKAAQQPGVSANSWQLSQQQLAPSSGVAGGHRKLPTRTSNVTNGKNFRNKISNSASAASLSANSEAVSLPIRHWWTAVYHHHGDQHNRWDTTVHYAPETFKMWS